MDRVFLFILNISITAAWLVLVVLVLRLALHKAPRWSVCLMWALVAVRLLLPFSVQSSFSLLPSAGPIPQNIASVSRPAIQSGIPAVNEAVNPVLSQHFTAEPSVQGNSLQQVLRVVTVVWLAGVAIMLLYSLISTLRLRNRVRVSIKTDGGAYICDDIDTPFILGVFRPRIYVPSALPEEQLRHVMAHEQAHLKRKDHLWKPLGFFLLSLHWFNPLLWVAFILLSRDIEQACDEKVIRTMDAADKISYSQALLQASNGRSLVLACPLAFGEVSVKARIKGIVNYKKPMLWIVLGAVALCVTLAVCFLTDPIPCDHTYESAVTLQSTCAKPGEKTFTCTACKQSYVQMIPVLAHAYGEEEVLTAASCTAEGTGRRTCADCGTVTEKSIPMQPHAYGEEYKVIKGATCVQTGIHAYTCTQCGYTQEQEVPTNDMHTFVQTVIRASTCTKAGEAEENCVLCGMKQTVTLELAEHKYYEVTGSAFYRNGCTSPGAAFYKCSGCDNMQIREVPAYGSHDYVRGDGYYERCTRCGDINLIQRYSKSVLDNTPWLSF